MKSPEKSLDKSSAHGSSASSSSGEHGDMPTQGTYSEKTLAQTAVKRLFSFTQIFFFGLTFLSSWGAVVGNLGAVFLNGGPKSLTWGMIVAIAGTMGQAASMAEMAAMQPIAGAQYHWTDHLAPERFRRFISWMQGWITWFAWVSCMTSVANMTSNMIQQIALINFPTYEPKAWHLTLMMFALLIFAALINMYVFWLIPWVELLAGVIHITLFVVFICVLVALAPRHDAEWVFFKDNSFSGWDNGFVSWNLGLVTSIWGLVGFDGVVHLSEEVRYAKNAVPKTLIGSIALNGFFSFCMVILILFTMGPIDNAVTNPMPIIPILLQATNSVRATTCLIVFMLIVGVSAQWGVMASVSRLTWAWARDGGLPTWFSYIDKKHAVPIRSIWLPTVIVMILACLNIASAAAFGAFVALGTFGLYMSYLIAIGCMLNARLWHKDTLVFGDWNLGRWGLPINIFALIFTGYVSVFLPFPQFLPVNKDNMNYSLPIFAATTLCALLGWVFYARKNWPGLNKEVIKLVVFNGGLIEKSEPRETRRRNVY